MKMDSYIKSINSNIPRISTDQMIEVDRLMIEEYGIDLIQMMENAGRCLAILTRERFFGGDVEGKNIAVLAGTGGNGGGALVAARRLHSWGATVIVIVSKEEERFTPIPQHQLKIIRRMGVSIHQVDSLIEINDSDAILDGIIGYSLNGDPNGPAAEMIEWANKQTAPSVSLDTPSGLDLTSGTLYNPIVKAAATLTLAMPKIGLYEEAAKAVVGELYLGDISVPKELYQENSLGLNVENIFRFSDVIRLE